MSDPTIDPTNHAVLDPLELAAFWARVDVGQTFQCWDWKGARTDNGYGKFQGERTHRLAYRLVRSKLTPEQVDFIRRNPERLKQVEMARRFGVSISTISYVRSGTTYKADPLPSCIGRA